MSRHEIGARIGAMLGRNKNTCQFLGYGIYEGDFIPPSDVGGFNIRFPNPRLKLDNGDIVWGCEVWWGAEDEIKPIIEAYQAKGGLEMASIKEARAAAKGH